MARILNQNITGVLVAAAAAVSMLAGVPGCGDRSVPADGGVERVVLGDRTFDLELAMSNESRRRGLGGRDALSSEGGMFFVFPDARMRRFWMYDCLIPIDIAFIGPNGYVTAIHTMPAEPLRSPDESPLEYESRLPGYGSGYRAQFAIELAPGTFDALGIQVGDQLPIPRSRLKVLGEAADPE